MEKLHKFDETFDSQSMYRIILETMSNPTRVKSIKEFSDKLYGNYPQLLSVAMTLLDNEVSFNTMDNSELEEQISLLTHSECKDIESADYIFVSNTNNINKVIANAKSGTLEDPHISATIVVLYEEIEDTVIKLNGPGIDGSVEFKTSSIVSEILGLRDEQYFEFPMGIDFIFISDKSNVFCIPRSICKEVR